MSAFQAAWARFGLVAARVEAGDEEQRFLDEVEADFDEAWDRWSRLLPPIASSLQAWAQGQDGPL